MKHPAGQSIVRRKLPSLLAAAAGSLGSQTWEYYFVLENGADRDVIQEGKLACAWFISTLLVMFRLIKYTHTTVANTVSDLEQSGWQIVESPQPGAILIWEATKGDDPHEHIGLYMGEDMAISNSTTERVPVQHHWTYQNSRTVTHIFVHPELK